MPSQPEDFSRVNRPVSAAGAYYTSLAPWYDFLAGSEKKFISQGLEMLSPKKGEKVLEIGSGTGYAQIRIIKQLGEGLSVGLDLSPGMMQISRLKVDQAGLSDRKALVQGNGLDLPFPARTFEGVFSSFTMELIDTPYLPTFLQECQRVLKPSGRLVIVSLSKDRPLPLMGRLYDSLHNRFPKVLDCRPIPAKKLLTSAGFVIEKVVETSMWGLPVAIIRVVP